MITRFLLSLFLFAGAAQAQVSNLPANTFYASPLATTGPLTPRVIGPADLPFTQAGTGAVQQKMQAWARRFCVTPNDFGAAGNGSTDDTAAFNAAVTASIAGTAQAAKCLYLPGGNIYRLTANVNIVMPANSVGPKIYGDGAYNSRLLFDSGFGLTLSSSTAMFYGDIQDFAVVGNFAGPQFKFSTSTTDAINGFNISGVVINNNSANAANIGAQFNGVYNSHIAITTNCSGHTNGAGVGTGIQVVAGTMNTFSPSSGSCNIGLQLTSTGNTVSGNSFLGMDLEVNGIDLQIDSGNVTNNTFIGNIYTYFYALDVGINATAGSGNVLLNPYGGGSGTFCGSFVGLSTLAPASTAFQCGPITAMSPAKPDQLINGGGWNIVTLNSGSQSGTYQVDCGLGPLQTIINGTSPIVIAAPALDGQCSLQVQGTSNTQAVTFSNISVSPTGFGDTYVTSLSKTATVTISIASPGVITWTAHGLVQNNVVYCQSTGALPTGLTAFNNYYVIPTGANTFNLATSPGGAAINTSGSQSGTQTCSVPPVFNLYIERHNGLTTANWKQSQ